VEEKGRRLCISEKSFRTEILLTSLLAY